MRNEIPEKHWVRTSRGRKQEGEGQRDSQAQRYRDGHSDGEDVSWAEIHLRDGRQQSEHPEGLAWSPGNGLVGARTLFPVGFVVCASYSGLSEHQFLP